MGKLKSDIIKAIADVIIGLTIKKFLYHFNSDNIIPGKKGKLFLTKIKLDCNVRDHFSTLPPSNEQHLFYSNI